LAEKQRRNKVECASIQTKPVLDETQRAQFDRDGFILMRGLISREQIGQISNEIDALHERMSTNAPAEVNVSWEQQKEGRPRRIRQLMHSEKVSPGLNGVLRSNEVLDVIEALIGSNISLFHSKLLMKAAQDGTVTPWHQDYAYWKRGANRPVQLNCMLAIDPATLENGCIQFVPGTHKAGLQSHEIKKGLSFGVYLPGYFDPRPDAVAVEMQPGDCIFFGPLVIHGSDGNRSSVDRRANTAAYTVTGDDETQCREVLRRA
jgi:ectoine hydroxylase-related dioxygenase (phytanoyl-CoA dioxygenase family)